MNPKYQKYLDRLDKHLEPGAFYEDCRYHPMVCVTYSKKRDLIVGISLVDGELRGCSFSSCGAVPLSPSQAFRNRIYGMPPSFFKDFPEDKELPDGKFPKGNPNDIEYLEDYAHHKKLRRK